VRIFLQSWEAICWEAIYGKGDPKAALSYHLRRLSRRTSLWATTSPCSEVNGHGDSHPCSRQQKSICPVSSQQRRHDCRELEARLPVLELTGVAGSHSCCER
jgi:hypothetical protein